jgi:putative serine protease PepD
MPKSLWADRGKDGDEHEWLAAPPVVRRRAPDNDDGPPPEPPKRRPGWLAPAISGVVAAVAVAVVLIAFGLVNDNGGGDNGDQAATTLPAAKNLPSGKPANVAAVYARVAPSVASIRSSDGTGTGFVIDKKDLIVTNAHVVGTDKAVRVRFGEGSRQMNGIVIGRDTSSDLAIVRLQGDTSTLKPLELANSDNVHVGDPAIAIGNPFGLDRTATAGIVSATGRSIKAPNGFSIDDAIQTDAPINPGNTGGPLLNSAGQVIGVNSQIESAGGGGNVGIGFAVSSNTVREVVPRLEHGSSIRRAYLGVQTTDAIAGGADVVVVEPGKPADKAGIMEGDVIVGVDGERVTGSADVARLVQQNHPGDKIKVEVERLGQRQEFDVTLATRPANAP